jgi:hypothetical protein
VAAPFPPGKVYFVVAGKIVGVHTIFLYCFQVGGSAGALPEKPTGEKLISDNLLNTHLNTLLKMILNHKTV